MTAPPTSYMKVFGVNLHGIFFEKINLKSGIKCWQHCRDKRYCDVALYESPHCQLYSPGTYSVSNDDGQREAYFKAEAPVGYTVRLGDCPGNDLWHLFKSNASLEECAKRCNNDAQCRAFMWYDRRTCYPKSVSCESTSLDNTRNVFYSKIDPIPCPHDSVPIESLLDYDQSYGSTTVFKENFGLTVLEKSSTDFEESSIFDTIKRYFIKSKSKSNHQCEICPPGSFMKSSLCEFCPVGQYQDKEGESNCNGCPSGGNFLGSASCALATELKMTKHSDFIYTVGIEVGTPGQYLNVMMDSGSAKPAVLDFNACRGCNYEHSYDYEKSSTSKIISEKQITQKFVTHLLTGYTYEDVVHLNGLQVENQELFVARQNALLSHYFQSVVGLRYNFNKDVDDRVGNSILQSLVQQELLQDNLFSVSYLEEKFTFGKILRGYEETLTYVPLGK